MRLSQYIFAAGYCSHGSIIERRYICARPSRKCWWRIYFSPAIRMSYLQTPHFSQLTFMEKFNFRLKCIKMTPLTQRNMHKTPQEPCRFSSSVPKSSNREMDEAVVAPPLLQMARQASLETRVSRFNTVEKFAEKLPLDISNLGRNRPCLARCFSFKCRWTATAAPMYANAVGQISEQFNICLQLAC